MAYHTPILPFYSFVFSPVFSSALSSVFSKWDLPVFTLPFNMALSMYLSATGHYNPFFPSTLITPGTSVPNVTWPDLSALQVRYTISLSPIPTSLGSGRYLPVNCWWTSDLTEAQLWSSLATVSCHLKAYLFYSKSLGSKGFFFKGLHGQN